MIEAELPRVQHLAREIFRNARRINFIAEHRMTEMMKVHANLMGASAVQPAFNQACIAARAKHAILGFGCPPAEGSHPHPLSMHRVSSDFFFDYASCLAQLSGDEREINLFHCARGELFG